MTDPENRPYSVIDDAVSAVRKAELQWRHEMGQLEEHNDRLGQRVASGPAIVDTKWGHAMEIRVNPGTSWTEITELVEGIEMPIHVIGELE